MRSSDRLNRFGCRGIVRSSDRSNRCCNVDTCLEGRTGAVSNSVETSSSLSIERSFLPDDAMMLVIVMIRMDESSLSLRESSSHNSSSRLLASMRESLVSMILFLANGSCSAEAPGVALPEEIEQRRMGVPVVVVGELNESLELSSLSSSSSSAGSNAAAARLL